MELSAALVEKFIDNGTWDDIGGSLSWTELHMIVRAARETGNTEWAEGFRERAVNEYDPEGYWDWQTSQEEAQR